MAVTQFEPADARRCFPCWDEPACKATFKIALEVPSEVAALSNMPVVEEKLNGNIKTVHYQESPIMSTYLVAVVIGLFDYVEDFTSDGIKVRVYCQVSKANQGKFALDVAVKTLDLYKKYFAVPYSLPKLDMIAIPDFVAGAMENYGLVTYCETALLYDEKHSAASNKQTVATVVAHELAHQWFGNLVTMEWWTHLWLNEGFATWVSYLATDSLFPEWKIWTQFLDESSEGLRLDGLAESHPIEACLIWNIFSFQVEINHACEIDEIFDAISYRKGASVIRMLQSYLGPECFQRALASYIKRYACSNAKTEDLWAVLEDESGEPVNKLMNSWTKQKGYPVVTVRVKDQKLEFDQSQFLLSGSHGDEQWIVPITLCCCSYDARKNFLLQAKSESLDTKEFLGCSISQGCLKETGAWIKINVDQTGFYRVKYDDELAGRLRYAIEAKFLSATDRFGILDDSYALCMACQQPLASLLSLMCAYREELEYTVLSNLISISYKIARIAADATPELLGYIEQFFINLFQYPAEMYVRDVSTMTDLGCVWIKDLVREKKMEMEKARSRPTNIRSTLTRLRLTSTRLIGPRPAPTTHAVMCFDSGQAQSRPANTRLTPTRHCPTPTRLIGPHLASTSHVLTLDRPGCCCNLSLSALDVVISLLRALSLFVASSLSESLFALLKSLSMHRVIKALLAGIKALSVQELIAEETGLKVHHISSSAQSVFTTSSVLRSQTLVPPAPVLPTPASHLIQVTGKPKPQILLDECSYCHQKGHWKHSCPNRGQSKGQKAAPVAKEDLIYLDLFSSDVPTKEYSSTLNIADIPLPATSSLPSLISLALLVYSRRHAASPIPFFSSVALSSKSGNPDLPAHRKLGWDPKQGESHLDAMLRGELLAALVHFGHDIAQDEARRRFDVFLDDRHTALLSPDIRRVAYVAVMQNVSSSSRSGYESLLKIYRETDQSQEKTRILGSLASCPDPDIVLEVLNFVLSSEVRSQDAIFGVHVGTKGRETVWRWLKENWDHISKTWGSGFLITQFVSAVVSPFSSYEKAKEVEDFFASRAKPSIARTLKQSLERVNINAKWVQSIQNERHLPGVVLELAYRKY
ncbi:aminopeptidase M1 [Actinidia rufa]|uniref:Alpha-aminoacylpeptide hydrolase n=1 Tax=Actinidia rufa TaxID=165716 RepID=A0A7J0FEY4_9ERIC|nr:aminopeptidase M1 [Actinidia rufa]